MSKRICYPQKNKLLQYIYDKNIYLNIYIYIYIYIYVYLCADYHKYMYQFHKKKIVKEHITTAM